MPNAAEVGVGGQRSREAELGGARSEVVAVDPGDPRRQALLGGDLAQLLGQPGGVEPAGVGDDPDALLQGQRRGSPRPGVTKVRA